MYGGEEGTGPGDVGPQFSGDRLLETQLGDARGPIPDVDAIVGELGLSRNKGSGEESGRIEVGWNSATFVSCVLLAQDESLPGYLRSRCTQWYEICCYAPSLASGEEKIESSMQDVNGRELPSCLEINFEKQA